MSREKHRSREPQNPTLPSHREVKDLQRVQEICYDHSSGGTFNMIAMWRKGATRHYGFNRLDRKASTISDTYADVCGEHAELSLYRKYRDLLKGGTVFVAGAHEKSENSLDNTRPCKYCMAILDACGVKNVVYFCDGAPKKAKIREMI